jgi:hypothetical protein
MIVERSNLSCITTYGSYIMENYNEYKTFYVLDEIVEIISFDTDYGVSTVAEINGHNYYLGDMEWDIGAAIMAWQIANDRYLTDDEFTKTIKENW